MQFFVLWLVFLLWLVFPFIVFPYRVFCKRQHMLQIFRHFCFCVTTVKFLQSLFLFEIFLLNYCSAGVIELQYILIHCETKHYLNTKPHYTLSKYITELKAILVRYRTIPHPYTLPSYTPS